MSDATEKTTQVTQNTATVQAPTQAGQRENQAGQTAPTPQAGQSEQSGQAEQTAQASQTSVTPLLLGADDDTPPHPPSFILRVCFALWRFVKMLGGAFRMFFLSRAFSHGGLLFVFSIALIVFVVWASAFSLEKTVKAPGVVLAVMENQVVAHLEGGIIKKLYVQEGDTVTAGQALMLVENTDISRERSRFRIKKNYLEALIMRLRAEVFPDLEADFIERSLYNKEYNQQYGVFVQNKRTLYNKITILRTQKQKIKTEIAGARVHLENVQEEYKIAQEQVQMLSPLVQKGVGSTQLLLQRQADMARLKTSMSEIVEQIKSLEFSLQEANEKIKEEQENFYQEAHTEIATNTTELASVLSDLQALDDSIDRNILRSPVAGTVYRILNSTPGGIVRAGDALVEIVPNTGSIRVEAKVQPQDRSAVYTSQKAKVRPSMYSFSLDTMLVTQISSISPQTFIDEMTRTYYYKVLLEADINETSPNNQVVAKNFLPGMTVEVNIISGSESLLSYIFTPIMRGLNNSLTERSTR